MTQLQLPQMLSNMVSVGFVTRRVGWWAAHGKNTWHVCSELFIIAKQAGKDVVLIDTAGRMQNNEPLMKALSKVCYYIILYYMKRHIIHETLRSTKYNVAEYTRI